MFYCSPQPIITNENEIYKLLYAMCSCVVGHFHMLFIVMKSKMFWNLISELKINILQWKIGSVSERTRFIIIYGGLIQPKSIKWHQSKKANGNRKQKNKSRTQNIQHRRNEMVENLIRQHLLPVLLLMMALAVRLFTSTFCVTLDVNAADKKKPTTD